MAAYFVNRILLTVCYRHNGMNWKYCHKTIRVRLRRQVEKSDNDRLGQLRAMNRMLLSMSMIQKAQRSAEQAVKYDSQYGRYFPTEFHFDFDSSILLGFRILIGTLHRYEPWTTLVQHPWRCILFTEYTRAPTIDLNGQLPRADQLLPTKLMT